MTAESEPLEQVRAACLAFPAVEERPSHGAPTFFVRGKKSFVAVWVNGHHDLDCPHLWCAAPVGAQQAYVGSDPASFFVPPYVGHRGWLGVRLDRDIGPTELAELCQDAYREVAPATLVRELDQAGADSA